MSLSGMIGVGLLGLAAITSGEDDLRKYLKLFTKYEVDDAINRAAESADKFSGANRKIAAMRLFRSHMCKHSREPSFR